MEGMIPYVVVYVWKDLMQCFEAKNLHESYNMGVLNFGWQERSFRAIRETQFQRECGVT